MIDNSAFCVLSTRLRARINTSLINTRSIWLTLRVYHTLGFTIWWRSNVVRKTRTYWLIVYFSAHCINSTRWGIAYIYHGNVFLWKFKSDLDFNSNIYFRIWLFIFTSYRMTNRKWSSGKTRFAIAHWFMVRDVTISIISTNSWAWIHAFVSGACHYQSTVWIR